MKYLIIGHKFGKLGRGGYHISKRFCDEHSEYCDFLEDKKARNLAYLNTKYRRIIFRTQVPRCYSIPVNFVRLNKINHLIYLREEHLNPLYNSCTNGFYYFKAHKFDNYIPMITDFPVQEIKPKQEICLGYYKRYLTPDSFDRFMSILDSFKYKINVTIMGDPSPEVENHNNVLHYNHTNDNVQFFSEITHYFYPTSKHFIDPFPHSVIEAVQTGKSIIFPKIERDFKDGIDEIKENIYWYDEFHDNIRNLNKNHPFKAKIWKNFYKKVFDCTFSYKIRADKFKSLYEFIQGEVI